MHTDIMNRSLKINFILMLFLLAGRPKFYAFQLEWKYCRMMNEYILLISLIGTDVVEGAAVALVNSILSSNTSL